MWLKNIEYSDHKYYIAASQSNTLVIQLIAIFFYVFSIVLLLNTCLFLLLCTVRLYNLTYVEITLKGYLLKFLDLDAG
ncbi:hypothetical protein ACJX0J_038242, partial [Zea mays]